MKVRQFLGKARESSALGVIGQSSKRRAEHGIQSRLHGGRLSFDQPVGPEGSLVEDEGIVQKSEGLCRHIGGIAVAARDRGAGKVEGIEKARTFVPGHFDIDAAAAITIQRSLVKLAIVLGLFPVGLNARTVHGAVQPAGNRQNRVANRFTFEAPDRIMRQKPVLGIARQRFRRGLAGLLEGLRHQQKANLLLDGPTVADKLRCQRIQQLGMRRPLAVNTKIVGCRHNAAPKHMKPDPVDHDARGQRI